MAKGETAVEGILVGVRRRAEREPLVGARPAAAAIFVPAREREIRAIAAMFGGGEELVEIRFVDRFVALAGVYGGQACAREIDADRIELAAAVLHLSAHGDQALDVIDGEPGDRLAHRRQAFAVVGAGGQDGLIDLEGASLAIGLQKGFGDAPICVDRRAIEDGRFVVGDLKRVAPGTGVLGGD